MSFRSIVRDVRDSFGNISRRGYEVFLSGHCRGKTSGSTRDMYDKSSLVLYSCWANLPQELLIDIIKRMEESESTWPSRKHVLACAAVCRTWREMCKEIIKCPELSGKITFLASLKQPGARNGNIQCFIRRDEANSTYRLYLCLSNEAGKFLLSSKRIRRTTCTEYIIATDANNISRSSKSYAGRLKSNFLGTKFLIYDTQPLLYIETGISGSCQRRHRFYSRKVSPRILSGSYNTAQITYELNVLGTRCPRRMNCMMYSIPASSLAPGGSVACRRHPEDLFSHSTMEDSFHRSMSFSKSSIMDHSIDFSSCRFSDTRRVTTEEDDKDDELKMKNNDRPLVLQNKSPRWHEQLECWCLNFCGRVTVASVKNFQLVASTQSPAGLPTPEAQPAPPDHDKIILQFGKIGRDRFTMDYRYPLSAFQAFAICLSSFDTKIACE